MAAEAVVAALKKSEKEGIARWMDWLRIPSVSTEPRHAPDCRKAAEWCAARLREAGFKADIHDTGSPKGSGRPIVLAECAGPPGSAGPHVLFYGHYDVQPADPVELWESPPFEPVIRPATPGGPGERVVARGANDDKGQVSTFLEAALAWKKTAGAVPIRITALIEGEEESGSVNLEAFLHEHAAALREADVCVISDTGMPSATQPAITYGVRGLVYYEVILHGPDQDLHSGLWGGRCPNPINELTKVLARLWDADRRVTIPGFYDRVREPSAQERAAWAKLPFDQKAALKKIGMGPEADVGEKGWTPLEREWARPTAEINGVFGGYQGAGAKTVIPAKAGAKVSFRLVDDQDPADIGKRFEQWLRSNTPPGCRWEITNLSGGPPGTVRTDSPHLEAARRALEKAAGVAPALIKSGGSIPVVGLLKSILGLETILMGFGLDDDRVHSPNEKFELACWRMGAAAHVWLMEELANLGKR
jgi:acetylornithine deacetylase/succinyl-diaminopimelate desuccinylase-like protein